MELVTRLACEADYVIAVDRGAQVLRLAGIEPDVFCGDDDSASGEDASWAHRVATRDILYPSEKYATDLSLAIDCARHEAARRSAGLVVTVTCATGGRLDHQLAVLGLLAKNADANPRIVEDGLECRILSPDGTRSWDVGSCAEVGATFSALALEEGALVSEKGMRWELDHHRFSLLDDLGVSNVILSPDATVTCDEGVVAAFLLNR